ncbi:Protein of unknown function [Planctomicrobium piriforme]|uniref:DUF2721 domain-containing protein n=2 Tax=Planctomicrobium piriforme TaxID=1576369 RepID=A0A1I3F5C0_9PLAN|nr:Protein of unknown function [Planctomicrobium piriforme]
MIPSATLIFLLEILLSPPLRGTDNLLRMDASNNPFAILSLIVAPAILTNASSVLIMSTSNRLARAVDRARELSKQLEAETDLKCPTAVRRLKELATAEDRALLLLKGLRSFYVTLGAFSCAALLSLLGAVLAPFETRFFVEMMEIGGVAAGVVAVTSLMNGSRLLLRETRIAVQVLSDRAAGLRARAEI